MSVGDLVRITAPHFVAAVVFGRGGRVRRAAPIVHYMLDWRMVTIEAYCAKKGWRIEVLPA